MITKKGSTVLIYLVLLLLPNLAQGSRIITLTDSLDHYEFLNRELEIFSDGSSSLSIADVCSEKYSGQFKPNGKDYIDNENINATYWIRFRIKNHTIYKRQWILESYNYRINNLTFYLPQENGGYLVKHAGDVLEFAHRDLQHKNLIFHIDPLLDDSPYYYLCFRTGHHANFHFVIRSLSHFTVNALNEYYLLGLFYGMLIIIAIYNLFLYFSFKDRALIFYVLYVVSVAFFSLCNDGLGFQYLWPDKPFMNHYAFVIAVISGTSFLLLYTSEFLTVKTYIPLINKLIYVYIFLRVTLFIICYYHFPHIKHFLYLDLLPIIVSYMLSIVSFLRGYRSAAYLVTGFTLLLLAAITSILKSLNIVPSNFFTAYVINIAALAEMLLLSFALGRRIRILKAKEIISRHLERKIHETTSAMVLQKEIIREKMEELDTFIYRTAHDIKGPLKSIKGLADLGLKDLNHAQDYLEHIKRSSRHLENIVNDLFNISSINNKTLNIQEIDFEKLSREILLNFITFPGFDKLHIRFTMDLRKPFYSEKTLLHSVFQNLIENAVKYRDPKKIQSILRIAIIEKEDEVFITFEDNGLGIGEAYLEKIFHMFFKLSSNGESSGLGLYIVKISIEKLKGTIEVESKERKGTTFKIRLKNLWAELQSSAENTENIAGTESSVGVAGSRS